MLRGDDCSAAAKPTERFAKRDVVVEGQVSLGLLVGLNQFVKPLFVVSPIFTAILQAGKALTMLIH